MRWDEKFYRRKRGEDCPLCKQGRPDETRDAMRYFAGEYADAYLRRPDIQPGLSIVVFRGRHVVEPTDLDPHELIGYLSEVFIVGRAIEDVMHPIKMNYNLLGNSVPHLHTHIVPRYEEDPRPGWPFPFPENEPDDMPLERFEAQISALRERIEQLGPPLR